MQVHFSGKNYIQKHPFFDTLAIYHGKDHVVELLLTDNNRPSQYNVDNALYWAVRGANTNYVKKVIAGGANVNVAFSKSSLLGETLQLMREYPQQPAYIDIAVLLFGHNATLPDEDKDITVLGKLLIVAINTRNLDLITELLGLSPKLVKLKGNCNMTPLHIAAELGHTDVLKLLIRYGAVIDARTTNDAAVGAPTFRGPMEANIDGGVTLSYQHIISNKMCAAGAQTGDL